MLTVVALSASVILVAQERTAFKSTLNRYGSYTVYVAYDNQKAQAGAENLQIDVRVETPGTRNLTLVECLGCKLNSSVFSHVSDPKFMDEVPPDPTNILLKTSFSFDAGIKKEVVPRQYKIELRFEPPDKDRLLKSDPQYSDIFVSFPLNVGVSSGGLLSVKEPKAKFDSCIAGATHRFPLAFHNGFNDYTVNLSKIVVSTTPSELFGRIVASSKPAKIDGNTIVLDTPLGIPPSQEDQLTIDLEMAGMSAGNYLSGFAEESQVEFKLVYDDGFGRTISDYSYLRPVRLKPRPFILFVAVMLGISAGVFIMSVWKILKYEGNGLRKGLAVLSTVVIGLIVSVLALQGELNISLEAFKIRASYDKPLMLFILSLIATVSGTPALKKFFGLDRPAQAVPAAPATAGPEDK